MTELSEYLPGACPHCGGFGSPVASNPEWLKQTREAVGIAQATLAKSLGLSAQYLCDIEHGRRDVPQVVHEAYRKLLRKRVTR